MIVMPRRSVTRFFIPLIDVLTLLFCIFLLMPLFQENQASGPEGGRRDSPRDLPEENASLKRELHRLNDQYKPQIDLQKLQAELERLRKEKIQALQERLFVRVLEIDPRNGTLFYPDPAAPGKQGVPITSSEKAQALIRRHQQQAGGRELYYIFLLPHGDSGYPTEQQFGDYRSWFAGVASGVGNAEGPG